MVARGNQEQMIMELGGFRLVIMAHMEEVVGLEKVEALEHQEETEVRVVIYG